MRWSDFGNQLKMQDLKLQDMKKDIGTFVCVFFYLTAVTTAVLLLSLFHVFKIKCPLLGSFLHCSLQSNSGSTASCTIFAFCRGQDFIVFHFHVLHFQFLQFQRRHFYCANLQQYTVSLSGVPSSLAWLVYQSIVPVEQCQCPFDFIISAPELCTVFDYTHRWNDRQHSHQLAAVIAGRHKYSLGDQLLPAGEIRRNRNTDGTTLLHPMAERGFLPPGAKVRAWCRPSNRQHPSSVH